MFAWVGSLNRMKAIVLIKLSSVEIRNAYQRLKGLPSVTEAFMVFGRFDTVIMLQAKNLEEIRRIILSGIHPIPGVIETVPCILVEDEFTPRPDQELNSRLVEQPG